MKKIILLLPFIVMACGPSKEEAQKKEHKRFMDSMEAVLKTQDAQKDSLEKEIHKELQKM